MSDPTPAASDDLFTDAYASWNPMQAADEIEFLFLPPPEFQGSEAVGLLRAANILRAASGERIGAAGYTQEDQDNLGQCGR